jgi:hypothetical protein
MTIGALGVSQRRIRRRKACLILNLPPNPTLKHNLNLRLRLLN